MFKTRYLLFALLVSFFTLFMSASEADAARRASLAQSQLIEDRTDVFLFPQLSTQYTNLLSFDYGAAEGDGNGLFLYGSESLAFGLSIHRGDVIWGQVFPRDLGHQSIEAIASPLGGGPYPLPETVIDALFGMDLGAGLLGARLSFGLGRDVSDPPDDPADEDQEIFFGLTAGYSLVGDLRLDSSLRLSLNTGYVAPEGNTTSSGTYFEMGIALRGYMLLRENLDLGLLADIAFGVGSSVIHQGDSSINGSSSLFAAIAGAGPVFHLEENNTIAGYAVLGVSRFSNDPNEAANDSRVTATTSFLPGFHLAADIELLSWLYFRTGVQYSYVVNTINQQTEDGDHITSGRGSLFGWRTGIGVVVGNFALDGTFQEGFVTGGPDFLGGAGGGLFSMASATYRF